MGPLVETQKLWKYFGPNAVLAAVDFAVHRGEVHVLAGANGAGKSTLVKILYGALEADDGAVIWKGQRLARFGIRDALEHGIAYIPQEVQVVPQLSIAENVFLGNLPVRRGLRPLALSTLHAAELRSRSRDALRIVGLETDVDRPAGGLSVAERQLVAIARALARRAELLLLDEPTASLSPAEIRRLFEIVARLRSEGSGIIFISHRMEEIEQIGDRITVLRDGRVVYSGVREAVSRSELVSFMTGRPPSEGEAAAAHRAETGRPELLRVEEMCVPGRVGPLSFSLAAGEVLGIAGVVGAGRTSLVRALFGAEPEAQGRIIVEGRRARIDSPSAAIAHGIALLTEDRKDQGLVPTADVATNISLASGGRFQRGIYFDHREEHRVAAGYVSRLAIRTPSTRFSARMLSGGNQQKVLLARWMCTGARVFLLDEPTRGIDVEAKRQVYALVRELAAAGHGVVFISSELPEVLAMAERILVLHRGQVVGEVRPQDADEHRLLAMSMGAA